MSKRILRYQGWLISAVFLAIVAYTINWSEFWANLRNTSPLHIIPLVGIYLTGFIFRGLRCRLLLPQLNYEQAVGGVLLGYGANNILPARLGELVRAHIVGKGAGISRSLTLSTVLVERILDGFTIVLLLIVGSGGLTLPDWASKLRMLGIILFSCLLLGVLLTPKVRPYIEKRIPSGRIGTIITDMLEGASLASRSASVFFAILAYSILIWLIEAMMFYYGFFAFGFSLSILASLFVLGVINLGILIPSSPGNVGVFQYFTILGLSVFAVTESSAAAYSIVLHVCQYVPVTLLALWFLPRFGVESFSSLASLGEKKTDYESE